MGRACRAALIQSGQNFPTNSPAVELLSSLDYVNWMLKRLTAALKPVAFASGE
jgi:hypothetical protein